MGGIDVVVSTDIVAGSLPQVRRVLVTSAMVELLMPLDPVREDTGVVTARVDHEMVFFLPLDGKPEF